MNHIINKYSKLAWKEYKTRHNWVGKVIHRELCKKFKFCNTNKCYMHNSESILKNETHKSLWDFDIQTDHLISTRQSKKWGPANDSQQRLGRQKKKKPKKSKKRNKYQHLARELKKLWNMNMTVIPIVIGALRTITKGLVHGLEVLEMGGQVDTIPTTALLRSATILRRVLETCRDLQSLKRQKETIS